MRARGGKRGVAIPINWARAILADAGWIEATPIPPPATSIPPTTTPVPTATPVPPTHTPVPPTTTPVPPTTTPVPPTATPIPPTATPVPPTNTPVSPTSTPVPPPGTEGSAPNPYAIGEIFVVLRGGELLSEPVFGSDVAATVDAFEEEVRITGLPVDNGTAPPFNIWYPVESVEDPNLQGWVLEVDLIPADEGSTRAGENPPPSELPARADFESDSCANYASQEEAQAAYDAAEPNTFDLDQDFDGIVCEDFFATN